MEKQERIVSVWYSATMDLPKYPWWKVALSWIGINIPVLDLDFVKNSPEKLGFKFDRWDGKTVITHGPNGMGVYDINSEWCPDWIKEELGYADKK